VRRWRNQRLLEYAEDAGWLLSAAPLSAMEAAASDAAEVGESFRGHWNFEQNQMHRRLRPSTLAHPFLC
jgi:hypothetical protein